MKEILNSVLTILAPFKDQVVDGARYGAIAALLAVAIAGVVFLWRYVQLHRIRIATEREEIETSRLEGRAEGLKQLREERRREAALENADDAG